MDDDAAYLPEPSVRDGGRMRYSLVRTYHQFYGNASQKSKYSGVHGHFAMAKPRLANRMRPSARNLPLAASPKPLGARFPDNRKEKGKRNVTACQEQGR